VESGAKPGTMPEKPAIVIWGKYYYPEASKLPGRNRASNYASTFLMGRPANLKQRPRSSRRNVPEMMIDVNFTMLKCRKV
jgi:hypothetical protein